MALDEIIAREINDLKVDCEPGCAWCCNQLIVITCRSDGKAVLDLARSRTSAEAFQAVTAKIREQERQIAQLPYQVAESKSWPCPFLKEDNKCLVYEARPIACRSVFSTDRRCCKAMLEAESYAQLSTAQQLMAQEITERATRLQLTLNNTRPIDGAYEMRTLLVSILDLDTESSPSGLE